MIRCFSLFHMWKCRKPCVSQEDQQFCGVSIKLESNPVDKTFNETFISTISRFLLSSTWNYIHSQVPATYAHQIQASSPERLNKMLKYAIYLAMLKKVRKSSGSVPFYLDQLPKSWLSILGRDSETHPPSESGRNLKKFLCNPADKPTNQQTNFWGENVIKLDLNWLLLFIIIIIIIITPADNTWLNVGGFHKWLHFKFTKSKLSRLMKVFHRF